MMTSSQLKRIAAQMIIPVGLIFISLLFVWKWPEIAKTMGHPEKLNAFVKILPILPYAILCLGIGMGWRYNNTGLILASLILTLSYAAKTGAFPEVDSSVLNAVSFLLPINMGLFSLFTKKHLSSAAGFLCLGAIIGQIFGVIIFCSAGMPQTSKIVMTWMVHFTGVSVEAVPRFLKSHSLFHLKTIPTPSFIACWLGLLFMGVRFMITRDIIIVGYIGAAATAFFGLTATRATPDTPIFFMAAGLILIFTNIEASFLRAYVDELTGLPGRRSLNETLANLGRKYTIAMMDIDHFKKFNDTYGHKTGDDVLKMVAAKLQGINGGAKTFRYGGEEFTAVFRGKTVEEVMPHLEQFRHTIADTPFMVRAKNRKKSSKTDRGSSDGKKQVRVTISIGVANPDKRKINAEKVIKNADKALYKSKKAGRNCIRTFS